MYKWYRHSWYLNGFEVGFDLLPFSVLSLTATTQSRIPDLCQEFQARSLEVVSRMQRDDFSLIPLLYFESGHTFLVEGGASSLWSRCARKSASLAGGSHPTVSSVAHLIAVSMP